METHLGGTITSLVAVGFMVWLAAEQNKFYTEKRVGILLGFGFFKGMSIGGLIELAIHLESSALVFTALVGTTAVFACFALAAMISPRRSYLYLGATLGSAISLMFWGSIVNIFFNSYFFFNVQLYAGLLIFVGYVVYDTQLIIEKAGAGSKDVCWDAAELFIDFVAIFVRILIILLKNSQEKKDKKRKN
jgi:FtsH-binding integral membrane protein